MKKKIVGILVVMLLIVTAFSITGKLNNFEREEVFKYELDVAISSNGANNIKDTYEIDEGQHLIVTITGRWDPHNPTKTICMWVDAATLPLGATFTPECHCALGEVVSVLEWTPAIGQAGTYVVVFYLGEICGVPLGTFSITIIVHPLQTNPYADYGDAPDNTAGNEPGEYPSMYNTVNKRILDRVGPCHLDVSQECLGIPVTTKEDDALITNRDADNCWPIFYVNETRMVGWVIFDFTIISNYEDTRYVNVLFDQNDDGVWEKTTWHPGGLHEWVIIN